MSPKRDENRIETERIHDPQTPIPRPPEEDSSSTFRKVRDRIGTGAVMLIGAGALAICSMVLRHEVLLAEINIKLGQIIEITRSKGTP